jgi:hypothetical protein
MPQILSSAPRFTFWPRPSFSLSNASSLMKSGRSQILPNFSHFKFWTAARLISAGPEIGALIEPATVDTRGKQHDRIAEEGTLPYGSSGRSEPQLKRPASHGEGSCARLVCPAG